jgi:hypothetical protein
MININPESKTTPMHIMESFARSNVRLAKAGKEQFYATRYNIEMENELYIYDNSQNAVCRSLKRDV